MTLLKEMIENIISENETEAKVNFHSYLTDKMQNLNEGSSANIIKIPNDKSEEFMNAAEKLFDVEFETHQGDFYTTLTVTVDNESDFKKLEYMANDFK